MFSAAKAVVGKRRAARVVTKADVGLVVKAEKSVNMPPVNFMMECMLRLVFRIIVVAVLLFNVMT